MVERMNVVEEKVRRQYDDDEKERTEAVEQRGIFEAEVNDKIAYMDRRLEEKMRGMETSRRG